MMAPTRPTHGTNAEKGRNAILSALFATTGVEGCGTKIEMASDPLFEHIKDRALTLAEARAAEEADNVAVTEVEFTILDETREVPPKTREAMFVLLRDRLDDIDDLLLRMSLRANYGLASPMSMSCGVSWRAS